MDLLNLEIKEILKDDLYLQLKESFIKKFKEEIYKEELKVYFYSLGEEKIKELELSHKSIKELLPKGFENNIKVLVYNKGPEIVEGIREFLLNDKFQKKLKIEIDNFLSNMNPMAAKFISSENIYLKLKGTLINYLDAPETMMNIVVFINDKIDKMSEKDIMDIIEYIPYEGKLSVMKAIVDYIMKVVIEDKIIRNVLDSLETKAIAYCTLEDLLLSLGITKEKISNSIFFK